MKSKKHLMRVLSVVLMATGLILCQNVCAQGVLSPAGGPGPLMKTLEQVEPRTPIDSVPFTINAPGSYYVTSNLYGAAGSNGITIASSDVTLDLNGFELVGVPGSLNGIHFLTFIYNITIRNGIIRDWGDTGVYMYNGEFYDLRVSDNGKYGMFVGPNSIVKNCISQGNGGDGILAFEHTRIIESVMHGNASNGMFLGYACTVTLSSSSQNGHAGIFSFPSANISDCTTLSNGTDGISTYYGSTVSGCASLYNSQHGIAVSNGCTVVGSVAYGNGVHGISALSGCLITESVAAYNSSNGIATDVESTVTGCNAYRNASDGILVMSRCVVKGNNSEQSGFNGDGAGIRVQGVGAVVEFNRVGNGDRGYKIDHSRNLIVKNVARDNGLLNYVMATNNRVGPLVTPPLSGEIIGFSDPDANGAGTTDPWANFSY